MVSPTIISTFDDLTNLNPDTVIMDHNWQFRLVRDMLNSYEDIAAIPAILPAVVAVEASDYHAMCEKLISTIVHNSKRE